MNGKNAGGLQSEGEPLFTELNKVLNIDRAERNSAAPNRFRSPGSVEIYGGQKLAGAVSRLCDLTFQLVTSLLIYSVLNIFR